MKRIGKYICGAVILALAGCPKDDKAAQDAEKKLNDAAQSVTSDKAYYEQHGEWPPEKPWHPGR